MRGCGAVFRVLFAVCESLEARRRPERGTTPISRSRVRLREGLTSLSPFRFPRACVRARGVCVRAWSLETVEPVELEVLMTNNETNKDEGTETANKQTTC